MNPNKIFRRLPIRMKLTIAFAAMALLPLTIMGVYGIWITVDSLEKNSVAQVSHYVDLIKMDMDNLLEQTRVDIDYIESLDSFLEFARGNEHAFGIETLSRAIAVYCGFHPIYFQIRYLDEDGEEILRVVDQNGSYSSLPPRGEHAGARFYQHALDQASSRASLSIPVELKHPTKDDVLIPAVSLVRQSQDHRGHPRGIWVADLYAETLIDLLRPLPEMPGGELVLCDAQGHYLYHPAKKKDWQQLLATRSTDNVHQEWAPDIAQAILSGDNGIVRGAGRDVVAYTPVWSDPSASDRGYVLYYRIPASVAFAPARRFGLAVVFLGVVTVFLVTGAAYLGAGQLTRPLMALSRGAGIIASGDFEHRIPVSTNDEIETLTEDFNRMALAMKERDRVISEHESKLQEYARGLEGMVEERTADLRESHRLLARTEKMAAVGRLAAGLAHEINNPVGIILNRIEAMRDDQKDDPNTTVREDLAVLARHAKRIGSITEDLLRFSRPREIKMAKVDLNAVCKSVSALIRPEYERRGVSLTVENPKTPPTVMGDQDRLEQIVLNLLDNALDASSLDQKVFLQIDRQNEKAIIRVRDSGSGVSKENLDLIFDPFFTTKGVGEGSGLGLTITDELVRDHGGAIRVKSDVNMGTEFTVELPLND
jgi:two-component system NtrC family sensor kinase